MEICNRGIQGAGRRWNHGHGRNYQKRVRRIQGPWGTSAFEGGGAQKSSEGQRRVRKWWYHGNQEENFKKKGIISGDKGYIKIKHSKPKMSLLPLMIRSLVPYSRPVC